MMSWRRGAFAVSLFFTVAPAQQAPTPTANPTVTGFLAKSLTIGGIERRYVLYLPRDYRADRRWPLVVFLNGMGECGTDGWKHIDVGLGPAMRKEPERWPFVVLFPQKPDKPSQWIDHDDMVMAMVAATEKECAIDDKQRFLTGLSQGGAGTWAIGARHADMWAAIAPVCGYGKPEDVPAALQHMPIWAFHGEADPTVPVQQTKALVAAVEAVGGKPLMTLYEKVGHNSWDKAYRESDLAEWLRVADDRGWAEALVHPQQLDSFNLEIDSVKQGESGPEHHKVRFWLTSGTWSVRRSRSGVVSKDSGLQQIGEPVESELPAPAAVKCLGECVRLLVRSGIADSWDPRRKRMPPAGDYIFVDGGSIGVGGRSVAAWPAFWSIERDPSVQVVAIRRVLELIDQLH